MTDVQTHTDTHANAERPAGASKRNDQASQGERRSFRADDGRGEPGMRTLVVLGRKPTAKRGLSVQAGNAVDIGDVTVETPP